MNLFKLDHHLMPESKVFRDPIHHYINVTHSFIWELINTKEMQRLRRIKQLGGTSQVYQTAEHSRFVHSLGVYEIIRSIVLDHETLSKHLSDYEKAVVMCAGLLHDLGHGPFSHAFEHVFKQDHEAYTVKMVLGKTEVNAVLTHYHASLAGDIARVIEKTHPNKVLIQLVSSQLDADRMDYLLRDSYFTGTSYGHFDIHRILRTMRIQDDQIVFKASGVQAIENYILARYHMYWQVYYHPVARSYEQLLIAIFRRIHDLYDQGYTFKTQPTLLIPILEERELTEQEYHVLDEPNVYFYFSMFINEEDAILSDLCDRFMNRKLFKYIETDKISKEALTTKLILHNFDPKYYLHEDDQVQIPYHYYGSKDGDIIIRQNHELLALPYASEIVHAILQSDKKKSEELWFFPKY